MLNVLPPVVRVKTKSQYLVALVCHAYRTKKSGEGSGTHGLCLQEVSAASGGCRVVWLSARAGRGARNVGGRGPLLHNNRRQRQFLGGEQHVDIFEKSTTGDATNAIGGFQEIIAGLSAVFPTEGIGEDERLGELTRTHEKTSAIKIPVTFYMHDFHRLAVVWLKL